jgi:hypothetical protein
MKYLQQFSFLFLLLILVNCGNEKKVYKKFDVIEIATTNVNDDDDVSAWNGGPGFEVYAEQLGCETNNNVKSVGSPDAIKGDTITLVGETVMPPTSVIVSPLIASGLPTLLTLLFVSHPNCSA